MDYNESFNEVIMFPGQTESVITLGVKDDGFEEGVETVEITFEYVNGCGETVITSSRVVILDPLPVEAVPSPVSCLDDDGNQTLGMTTSLATDPSDLCGTATPGAMQPKTPPNG